MTQQRTSPPGATPRESVARIDTAHPVGAKQPATEAPQPAQPVEAILSATSGRDLAANGDQLRSQAGQLAQHLQDKQRDIDQREAHLNARVAHLENELRTSRLFLHEREHEFREREAELQQSLSLLEEQLRAAAATEAVSEVLSDEEHQQRDAQLHRQNQALCERELRLTDGQRTLAEQAEALRFEKQRWAAEQASREAEVQADRQQLQSQALALSTRERDLLRNLDRQRCELLAKEERLEQLRRESDQAAGHRCWTEQLHDRQRRLEEADELLQEQMREVAQRRAELDQQQRTAQDELELAHEQFEHQRQRQNEQLAAARRKLDTRREQLAHREHAVKQLREETCKVYQETLEMRLVIQQMWSEIGQVASPAKVTRTLTQIRQQVSDQYRFAQRDLEQQRVELEQLAVRLEDRAGELRRQRDEFQTWLARRQQEIEEQAARLVAREVELDLQQQRGRRLEQDWSAERQEMQSRIRRLLSKNRSGRVAKA